MDIYPFIKEHGYLVFKNINNSLIGHQNDLSFIDTLEIDDCYTGVKDGRPIICGGVIKLWQGCYEGWVLGSSFINLYPVEVARTIRKETDRLIKKNKIHRLQTAVLSNFIEGHRFAKFLGMKEEGIMRKYDYMEQDYIRFARVM